MDECEVRFSLVIPCFDTCYFLKGSDGAASDYKRKTRRLRGKIHWHRVLLFDIF